MSNTEVNTTEAYRAEREALAKRADTYGIVKLTTSEMVANAVRMAYRNSRPMASNHGFGNPRGKEKDVGRENKPYKRVDVR